MRLRLAAFVLVLAGLVLLAKTARASCAIDEAYFGSDFQAVGCKLTVYRYQGYVEPPTIIAIRNGARIDVSGSSTMSTHDARLFIEDNECTGEGHFTTFPFDVFTVELVGVVAGDQLEVEGARMESRATVVDNPTCFGVTPPILACPDDTPETCPDEIDEDPDHGGCTSTRPSSTGLALLGLGLLIALRRRSK